MRQHLLRVTLGADAFKILIHAIRQTDQRVGWLEFETHASAPEPLETAADLGVLRAVAVSGERTVAVKPRRGAPVLKDLLREHFRGCLVVLVCGEFPNADADALHAAPRLEPRGEDWLLQINGEPDRELETEAVIRTLKRSKTLN